MKGAKQFLTKYSTKICKAEGIATPKISIRQLPAYTLGQCGVYEHDSQLPNIISFNDYVLSNSVAMKWFKANPFEILIHEIAHLKIPLYLKPHGKEFQTYYKYLLKKYKKEGIAFRKELKRLRVSQ